MPNYRWKAMMIGSGLCLTFTVVGSAVFHNYMQPSTDNAIL